MLGPQVLKIADKKGLNAAEPEGAKPLKTVLGDQPHWFFGPVRSCWKIYAAVLWASVLINIFALASSLYIMTVYDRVVPNNAIESLWAMTIMIAIVILFDFAMKILRGLFVDGASARIDQRVSVALFERIARHDTVLGRQATGTLAGTVRNFDQLKDFFGSATFTVIVDLPFVFLFIFVIYLIGGPIAFVPAVIAVLIVGFALILQPIIKRMTMRSQMQGKSKHAVMIEMVSALDTVKLMRGINLLRDRWLGSVSHHGKTTKKTKATSQLAAQFAQFGQQTSQVAIVVYGVYLVAEGNLTMGQLIACVILSGRVMAPLAQLTGLLGRMNTALAAYKDLGDILQGVSQEEVRADQVVRADLKGQVSLRGVSFTYEGQPEPTLKDVSFDLENVEKLAIVGQIGSGKTTLLRLLCGLEPPDSGAVLIDNADIRHIRPEDVRNHIAFVTQNPVLFSGTIRENILMGHAGASDEDLLEAARLSGVDKFVGMLPGGFDFPLSERGRELSAGMRQSVAIARALISKPSLLLLDEPTASLDAGSEMAMVRNLAEACQAMTVIFVTHRGPMMQMADKVLIMEQGSVRGFGPRDAVLQPRAQTGTESK